jgi:hypothetical protein
MKDILKAHPGTQALLAANAALILLVGGLSLFPAKASVSERDNGDHGTAELPQFGDTSVAHAPKSQLVDMLERPLFYVDRQLPEPRAAAVAPPTPLRLKLEGVALAGGSRIAVLRKLSDNRLIQLVEGMSHESWTLETIESDSARFTRGTEIMDLPLAPSNKARR